MKRAFTLVVILLIPIFTSIAESPFRVSGKTNDSGLRVRSGPELNAEVVGSLADDTDLEIIDMTDDRVAIGDMSARWYRFTNKWDGDEIEGWAYGFFIDVKPEDLLAKAIWLGRPELVRKLINEGANINARLIEEGLTFTQYELYEHKSSLLMEAVRAGNEDIVGILIDSGADPDTRMSHGEPGGTITSKALIRAVELEESGIVELLVKGGADLETEGIYFGGGGEKLEVTPLSAAAAIGNTTIARYLLDAGADVNHVLTYWHIIDGELPKTAMNFAEENGYTEITVLLRDYGGKKAGK